MLRLRDELSDDCGPDEPRAARHEICRHQNGRLGIVDRCTTSCAAPPTLGCGTRYAARALFLNIGNVFAGW
jgi:hypothetical protein